MSDVAEVVRKIVNPPQEKMYKVPMRMGRKKQIYLDALDIIVDAVHSAIELVDQIDIKDYKITIRDFKVCEGEVRFVSTLFKEKEMDVYSDLVRRSIQVRGLE